MQRYRECHGKQPVGFFVYKNIQKKELVGRKKKKKKQADRDADDD
jgi:hypothetical protein